MKARLAGALATLALLGAAPAAPGDSHSAAEPKAVAAHACSSGYTHAALSWGHKCLRAGQFCKRGKSANREYHRYDFHCRRDGHLTYY